jgi:hypothetical protein
MSEIILRYTLVDENGCEIGREYSSFDEAKTDAQKQGHLAVIVWDCGIGWDGSADLVWAPGNADTWPPKYTRIGVPTWRIAREA